MEGKYSPRWAGGWIGTHSHRQPLAVGFCLLSSFYRHINTPITGFGVLQMIMMLINLMGIFSTTRITIVAFGG